VDILALMTFMWLKSAKVYLKITFSCINLIYFLLHVEPQARAKHDFDFQPTANISLFFLPFWVLCSEYFFGNIIFVFHKKKFIQNPTNLFFR